MKEAMGGTWLFGLVIFFIILFASIVSVSLNWSRAYKIKDEMIREIEDNHGLTSKALDAINEYIGDIGYKSTGECSGSDFNKGEIKGYVTGKNYDSSCSSGCNYCVSKNELVTRTEASASFTETYKGTSSVHYCKTQNNGVGKTSMGHPSSAYYTVKVFFKLDMPIIGQVFGFDVSGETATIYNISEDDAFGTPADC